MKDVVLRRATPADCRAAWELICDMEQTELPYEAFSAIFERQNANDAFYCLAAESGGRVVGVLNMRFEEQLHHAGLMAEMMEFAIAEDFRNAGLGHEMFAEACRIARERGCPQLELACNKLRLDAHRFYRREGMQDHHFKFSVRLDGQADTGNRLGR